MRELILNDFYFLIGQIIFGFLFITYTYKRIEFPRKSRFLAGIVLIALAGSSLLLVDLAMYNLDLFNDRLQSYKQLKQDFPIYFSVTYKILKLVIPFSFAAVGAGLITNALISRNEQAKCKFRD